MGSQGAERGVSDRHRNRKAKARDSRRKPENGGRWNVEDFGNLWEPYRQQEEDAS